MQRGTAKPGCYPDVGNRIAHDIDVRVQQLKERFTAGTMEPWTAEDEVYLHGAALMRGCFYEWRAMGFIKMVYKCWLLDKHPTDTEERQAKLLAEWKERVDGYRNHMTEDMEAVSLYMPPMQGRRMQRGEDGQWHR